MQTIGSFFERFKSVAFKEVMIRQTIADAIEKHTSVKLDLKSIEFKNKIIRITGSSILKNAIFIKKEAISNTIRENNPNILFTDVR